ncbi:hypothetical protein EVAR_36099_1 [Eumeta japonica]|uniref:Uncharacterized protein n=1 Tax=Eumeta variegata TaxID=151549 RepID=A0A4C1YI01_EUMVA|nr:hypothetical protein EVAR_36099_1 [Eumeta japonica]
MSWDRLRNVVPEVRCKCFQFIQVRTSSINSPVARLELGKLGKGLRQEAGEKAVQKIPQCIPCPRGRSCGRQLADSARREWGGGGGETAHRDKYTLNKRVMVEILTAGELSMPIEEWVARTQTVTGFGRRAYHIAGIARSNYFRIMGDVTFRESRSRGDTVPIKSERGRGYVVCAPATPLRIMCAVFCSGECATASLALQGTVSDCLARALPPS